MVTDSPDPTTRALAATVEAEPGPCRCHQTSVFITPTHPGHCCYVPATQTCHKAEVAEWERKNAGRWAG